MSEQGAAEDPPTDLGRVLDAGALKAIAHPLRFRLLEHLIEHGPATASGLGREVGESSGSTSYHLRQLAEHGLIEEVTGAGNARDRWWQSVEGGYTLQGFEMLQRDDTREDATLLLSEIQKAHLERVQRWHREGHRWGRPWVEATIEATGRMRLTRDQLGSLSRELFALVDRYRDQQVPDDTPDSAQITVHLEAFPSEHPPSGARWRASGRTRVARPRRAAAGAGRPGRGRRRCRPCAGRPPRTRGGRRTAR